VPAVLSSSSRSACLRLVAAVALALHAAAAVAQQDSQVFINRTLVPADTIRMLERTFNTKVPAGRYWYDRFSGAWGLEDGPAQGFTIAGLPLGGTLPADISKGGTKVFINGRELHPMDVQGLARLVGPVIPGRYWLDAQGYAGLEGGPAVANLRVLAQSLYRQGNGVGENYGGGAGAYGNLNTGIGIITDGAGGAAVFTPR
jgi:hypothetical protein